LDQAQEAGRRDIRVLKVRKYEKGSSGPKQVETDRRENVELSAGTGRIRVKSYYECVGGVRVIAILGLS